MFAYHFSVVQCRDLAVQGESQNVALLAICPELRHAWLVRGENEADALNGGFGTDRVKGLLDLLFGEAKRLARHSTYHNQLKAWLHAKSVPNDEAIVLAHQKVRRAKNVKLDLDRLAVQYLDQQAPLTRRLIAEQFQTSSQPSTQFDSADSDTRTERRLPSALKRRSDTKPGLGKPAPDFAYTGQPEPGVCEWGEDLYGRNGRGWFIGFRVGDVVQRMRWIPPGTFQMGWADSDLREKADERHQSTVTLTRGYWLADTPVTLALWLAVMGPLKNRYRGNATCPMEQVSWDETRAFLERLNTIHPWLSSVLPTEAQWEYACRADTKTKYWSGDSKADLEWVDWCAENSFGRLHPVATRPANPWGLYDLHGNVSEWCRDFFGNSSAGLAMQDATGPKRGLMRVARGGSWALSSYHASAASRDGHLPTFRRDDLGFRLARAQVLDPASGYTRRR